MYPTFDGPPLDSLGAPPPDELHVDAFCIGAPKSGSTWFARVLDEHPEIQVSKPKEPKFLTTYASPYMARPPPTFMSSWRWYADCYPGDASINIDFSITMMADPVAPARVQSVFPDAKLLLVLRDPVARLYSAYKHAQRGQLNGTPHHQSVEPSFEEAVQNKALLRRSCYAELLESWLKVYPPDRFHVVTQDEIRKDPLSTVQRTFFFLDVDTDFQPPRLDRKVHPSPLTRGIREKITKGANWARAHKMGRLVDSIGRRFPYRFVSRLDRKKVRYPPMDPNLDEELRVRFLPEIEKIEQMFDLDLSGWKPANRRKGTPGRP